MKKYIFTILLLTLCLTADAQNAFKITNQSQHPYRHKPRDMNSVNTPADGQCATYYSATGQWKWTSCGTGGSTSSFLLLEAGGDLTLEQGGSLLLEN